MAYTLPVDTQWRQRGWKVKIRDRERVEPPHVTIMWRAQSWRLDLRSGGFMDKHPDPGQVPEGLLAEIRDSRDQLVAEWDRMYPENPVSSEGDENECG